MSECILLIRPLSISLALFMLIQLAYSISTTKIQYLLLQQPFKQQLQQGLKANGLSLRDRKESWRYIE